jgi:NCS1 family nucleobase:cation symporter-1
VTYSLLLDPVTYEPSELFRYTTASVPAFAAAGLAHYVLTKAIVERLGKGGYGN